MSAAKKVTNEILSTPGKNAPQTAQQKLEAAKLARKIRIKDAKALSKELERILDRLTIALNVAESMTQPEADPPLPSFIAGPGKKGVDNDPA